LGLEDEIVGITKFCIHPIDKVKNKLIVGGTKNFSLEKILQLNPDLVIANKEENQQQSIMELSKYVPVYTSYVNDFDSALNMIENIGLITDRKIQATEMTSKIENLFDELKVVDFKKKVIYMIWKQPFMTVGKNTFINSMIEKIGLINVFANKESNYPEISESEIINSDADLILLSTEPYKFSEKNFPKFNELLPNAKALVVNGEMFSWYGSRMQLSASYLQSLIYRINDLISE